MTPSVQRGATPHAATQIEATSVTLLVISIGDPFAALSQALRDGSSLVVTPSSIPVSATRRLDADLSSEESKELEDLDDEPVLGRRISESEEEEHAPPETEFMGMCFLPSFLLLLRILFLSFICMSISLIAETFERLGIAVDVGVSTATTPVAPLASIPVVSSVPISAIFTASVFAVPFILASVFPTAPITAGSGKLSFPFFLSSLLPRGPISLFSLSRFLISCLVPF